MGKRNTIKEIDYTREVSHKHIKDLGQYFTNYDVAAFMSRWVCEKANTVLDPAVGNSVFFKSVRLYNDECDLIGYEIDKTILDYFGNPTKAIIRNEDYLLNGWDETYDAIICNPPYNRFQAVSNRNEILDMFNAKLGVKYSGYTNLYILFLLKSIHQLSLKGRLAYIIPSEFLNSKYGEPIKKKLIEEKLLRAIINFQNNEEMFFNATTTCCILLIDREEKESIKFFNIGSPKDIVDLNIEEDTDKSICVEYDQIDYKVKWRSYLNQEEREEFNNLVKVSTFCSVTRGIATGANDFFCFSRSKAQKNGIPLDILTKCITRSADVKTVVFTEADFEELSSLDKQVFLLDIKEEDRALIEPYIAYGEEVGVNKKYLPSCRKPWYTMEQKKPAPIWVCPANRNSVKFVRNLAGIKALTTFHSVIVNDRFSEYIDVIFCYFITPIAQKILRDNRKELGNGLEKFQPNDLNTAYMLDVTKISGEDLIKIASAFERIKKPISSSIDSEIEELNEIFTRYLKKE